MVLRHIAAIYKGRSTLCKTTHYHRRNRLRQQNVGYATTQKRYSVGSSTVTLIMKRFKELGLTLEELRAMLPKAVEVAFYPPENLKRSEKPMLDFAKIHARMSAMK